jgi:hypothetical protein
MTANPLALPPADLDPIAAQAVAVAASLGVPAEHSAALAFVLLLAHYRERGVPILPQLAPMAERLEHVLHVASAKVEIGLTEEQLAAQPDLAAGAALVAALPMDWARLTRAADRAMTDGPDAFLQELADQLDVALSEGASA